MDVTARCTSRGDAIKMGEELRSHQKGSCPATVSIIVHPRGRESSCTPILTVGALELLLRLQLPSMVPAP